MIRLTIEFDQFANARTHTHDHLSLFFGTHTLSVCYLKLQPCKFLKWQLSLLLFIRRLNITGKSNLLFDESLIKLCLFFFLNSLCCCWHFFCNYMYMWRSWHTTTQFGFIGFFYSTSSWHSYLLGSTFAIDFKLKLLFRMPHNYYFDDTFRLKCTCLYIIHFDWGLGLLLQFRSLSTRVRLCNAPHDECLYACVCVCKCGVSFHLKFFLTTVQWSESIVAKAMNV